MPEPEPADLPVHTKPLRWVLMGDGESPHLLKWARGLTQIGANGRVRLELFALSTRGFGPEWDGLVAPAHRLALHTNPQHSGGNAALLRKLPKVGYWLSAVDADWLNPHYLTSSGTLALLAKRIWRLRARTLASAWGSDILVTPERSAPMRWLTQAILRNADLCTSDSQHMSARMQALGARAVETFPFGLEAMPNLAPQAKQPWLVFANRGLEPIYRPHAVLALFAQLHAWQPHAKLVVANDGGLRAPLQAWVQAQGLSQAVQFVGRLDAATQAQHYAAARWYVSLPESDSVAVSVLEAMAHGCVPLLSDLPANRELVRSGANGHIVTEQGVDAPVWQGLQARGDAIAAGNRAWVAQHGLFAPCLARLLAQVQQMGVHGA